MQKLLIIKLLIFNFNILLCASLSSTSTPYNILSYVKLNREKRYKRDLTYFNELSQPNYLTTILQKPYENDEASFWEKYINFLPTPNNWIPTLTRAVYDANPNHNSNPTPTATATVQYINAQPSLSASSSPLPSASAPLSTVTTTTTTTTTTSNHHPHHPPQIGTNLNFNAIHQPHITPADNGIIQIINNLPVVDTDEVDVVDTDFVSDATNLNVPIIPLKTNYYDADIQKIPDDDPAFKEALKLADALSNTDLFEKTTQLQTCLCGNKNFPKQCTKCFQKTFSKDIPVKANQNDKTNKNSIQQNTTNPEEKDSCKKFQSKFHYKPSEYKMNGFYESVQKLVKLFSEEKLKEFHKKSEEQRQKRLKEQQEKEENSKKQSEKLNQSNSIDQHVAETVIVGEKQQDMVADQKTQEDKPPIEEKKVEEQKNEHEQVNSAVNHEKKLSETPISEPESQESVQESAIEEPPMINKNEHDHKVTENQEKKINDEFVGNLALQEDEIITGKSSQKEENEKQIVESEVNEKNDFLHKDSIQDQSEVHSVRLVKMESFDNEKSEIPAKPDRNEVPINREMTQSTGTHEDQHSESSENTEDKIKAPESEQKLVGNPIENKSAILLEVLPETNADNDDQKTQVNSIRTGDEIETLQLPQKLRNSEDGDKLTDHNLLELLPTLTDGTDDEEKSQKKSSHTEYELKTILSTQKLKDGNDENKAVGFDLPEILPETEDNTNDVIQKNSRDAEKSQQSSTTQIRNENSSTVIDGDVELLPSTDKNDENQNDTEAAASDSFEKMKQFSVQPANQGSISVQNTGNKESELLSELLPESENEKNPKIIEQSSGVLSSAANTEGHSENDQILNERNSEKELELVDLLPDSEKEIQQNNGIKEINEIEAQRSVDPFAQSLSIHEGNSKSETVNDSGHLPTATKLDENNENSDLKIIENTEKNLSNQNDSTNENEVMVLDSVLPEDKSSVTKANDAEKVDSEHQSTEFSPLIVTITDQNERQPVPINIGTETGTVTKYTYQIAENDEFEKPKTISLATNTAGNSGTQNLDGTPSVLPENETQTFVEHASNTENENKRILDISEHLVTQHRQDAKAENDETTPEILPNISENLVTNLAGIGNDETVPELLPNTSESLVTSETQHSDNNTEETGSDETTPEPLPNVSDHLITSETQQHSSVGTFNGDNSHKPLEKDSTIITETQSTSVTQHEAEISPNLLNLVLDVVDLVNSEEKSDKVPNESSSNNQIANTEIISDILPRTNDNNHTTENIDLKHEINSTQELEGSASDVYDVISNPQPLSLPSTNDNFLQPSESVSINSLPALISLPGVALYFNRMLVENKVPTIGMSLHVNKAVIKHLPCGEQLSILQEAESENTPVTTLDEISEDKVSEQDEEEHVTESEHECSCCEPTTDIGNQIIAPVDVDTSDFPSIGILKSPEQTHGINSKEIIDSQENPHTESNYNPQPVLISYPTETPLNQPSNVDIKSDLELREPYTVPPLAEPIHDSENEIDTANDILHPSVPVHDHEEHSHPVHSTETHSYTHPIPHYNDHHEAESKQAPIYNTETKLEPSEEISAEPENYHDEPMIEPTEEPQLQLQSTHQTMPHFYHIPHDENLLMNRNPSLLIPQSENINLSTENISLPIANDIPQTENVPIPVENISPLMINVLPKKMTASITPQNDIRIQNEIEPLSFIPPKFNPLIPKYKLKMLLGEVLNKKMTKSLPKYATKLLSFHDLDMQGSEIHPNSESLAKTKKIDVFGDLPEKAEPDVADPNSKVTIPEHNSEEATEKISSVNPTNPIIFESQIPITNPSSNNLDEHLPIELETAASQQSHVVVKSPNALVSEDWKNNKNSKIKKNNSEKLESKISDISKSHTINPTKSQQEPTSKGVTLPSSITEKYQKSNENLSEPSENKAEIMTDNLETESQVHIQFTNSPNVHENDTPQATSLDEINSGNEKEKRSGQEFYNELKEALEVCNSESTQMDDSKASTDKFALELYTILDEIVDKYLQTRLEDESKMKDHKNLSKISNEKLHDSFSKSIQDKLSSRKVKRENRNEHVQHKNILDTPTAKESLEDKLQTSDSNIVTKYVLAPSSVIEMDDHNQLLNYINRPIATSENHQNDGSTKILPEKNFLSKLLQKILTESENRKISQFANQDENILSTVSDVFAEEIQNKLRPSEFNDFLDEFLNLNKKPKQFSKGIPELSELETPPINGDQFFYLRTDNFDRSTPNDETSIEQLNLPENIKKITFHMNSDPVSEEYRDDSTERSHKLNKNQITHHHYDDNECCSSELHQLEMNPSPAPLPKTSHSFDYSFETDEPHPLNIRPSPPTFLTGTDCSSHLKTSNSIEKFNEHKTKETNPFLLSLSKNYQTDELPSPSPLSSSSNPATASNDHQNLMDIYRNRRQPMTSWFEEYEAPPTPYTPSTSLYNSMEYDSNRHSSHRLLTKRSITNSKIKKSTFFNDKKDNNVIIRNSNEQNQFWKSLLKGLEKEFPMENLIQNKNNKKTIKTENQQKILSKNKMKKNHNQQKKKHKKKNKNKDNSKYSCETEVLNIVPIIEHDNAHLMNDSSRSSNENESQQIQKSLSVSKENLSNSDGGSLTNLSEENITSEEFIESGSVEV